MLKSLPALVTIFLYVNCLGQSDSSHSTFFIEPEFQVGRIAPNYQGYPPCGLKETVTLNIGSAFVDNKPWAKYYHHPDVGVLLSFSSLGNQHVFGNEVDVMPFITFSTSKTKKEWFIKLGLGASYFTTHYDTNSNPENLAIGNNFTWAFKLFLYRNVLVSKHLTLRIGGGYCHSSDGHTYLPNFGLNSGLIGISARFNESPPIPEGLLPKPADEQIPKTYFAMLRTGLGIHALGSPLGPVGGPKYPVYSVAVSGGVIFKNHIKVRAGITYRDYDKLLEYTESPYTTWQASNLFFTLGCEFLVGHVGMDVEGGINLYKPFYHNFYHHYEGSTATFIYFLKSTFPMRMGLNYYFIDPLKNTRFNIFVGADIDANFGQADFSELNVGYSFRLGSH